MISHSSLCAHPRSHHSTLSCMHRASFTTIPLHPPSLCRTSLIRLRSVLPRGVSSTTFLLSPIVVQVEALLSFARWRQKTGNDSRTFAAAVSVLPYDQKRQLHFLTSLGMAALPGTDQQEVRCFFPYVSPDTTSSLYSSSSFSFSSIFIFTFAVPSSHSTYITSGLGYFFLLDNNYICVRVR